MSSSHANGYDADLLNSVQIDKRAIQEGYSTDLLQEKHVPSPVHTPTPQRGNTGDSFQPSQDPNVLEAQRPRLPPKAPFYRTKKGIIAVGTVLVVIIIAAVVGGVVGSKNNKGGATLEPAQPEQGGDNGQVGTPADGDQAVGGNVPVANNPTPPLGSALASALSGITTLPTNTQQTSPTTLPGQPVEQPGNPGTEVPNPGGDGTNQVDPANPTANPTNPVNPGDTEPAPPAPVPGIDLPSLD